MATKIEINDDTQSVFVQFNDGTTLDWGPWDRRGPNKYLKDGETEYYEDGCTVTRLNARELTYDPNLARPKVKANK
jgi:hypothetical protein